MSFVKCCTKKIINEVPGIDKKGMTRADLAQSKGYQGIKATANGGADFLGSQYIYTLPDSRPASVKIKLSGSRGRLQSSKYVFGDSQKVCC